MSGDTYPTQPLPDPSAQWVLSQPPEPRKRRIWPWIVSAVVLVVLIVAAWFAGEAIARTIVTNTVRDQVASQLALPADQQIDVDVAGAVIPQLIGGTLDDITIASDDVPIGNITGDVVVHAAGVPIRGDAAASSASATIALDETQLNALLSTVDGFPDAEVTLAAPDVEVGLEIPLFGFTVPVGVSLVPSAADNGDLVLTPSSVRVAGADVSTAGLKKQFGVVADSILKDYSICIADQLPAAVTLTDVQVVDAKVVVDVDIDGGIISDSSLQDKGQCA